VTDEGRRKPASGRIDQLFSNIGRVLEADCEWQRLHADMTYAPR